MLGEKLDAADLGEGGHRRRPAYALRDRETGKVASAKYRQAVAPTCSSAGPPSSNRRAPARGAAVQIELADGRSVRSDAADVDDVLSNFFGRDVELSRAAQNGYTIDQYHPDEEN
jgi:uncharacterized protein YcbX